jgi:predicted transposase/invertase (TIGR01784 family)
VRRIYLDELKISGGAPPGLTILQIVTSAQNETPELVSRLLRRVRQEPDCERAEVIVELMEEVLIRRFHNLDRVEIRRMFKLHDIRKTRVWQEALEEGIEKGIEQGIEKGRTLEKRQLAARRRADGRTLKEIAHLMEISVAEVRRLIGR